MLAAAPSSDGGLRLTVALLLGRTLLVADVFGRRLELQSLAGGEHVDVFGVEQFKAHVNLGRVGEPGVSVDFRCLRAESVAGRS